MESSSTKGKGLSSRTHGSDKPNKEISKAAFKKKFSFSGKQMDEHFKARKSRTQSQSRMNPVPYLTGGQAKIAAKAPPKNKIDAKDFAVLKAEKAKGRGMGLQDEKVQPGKVMKAKKGKLFQGYLGTFDASAEASTPKAQRGVTTIVGVKPGSQIGQGRRKFKSLDDMRKAKGFKPGETSSQFNKRRMALAAAKKAAKANKYGRVALGVAAAGTGAIQYLKSKMNKKKDGVKKKMGGGMMQRPMGYKHGSEPGAGLLGGKRTGKAGLLGGTGTVKESGKRSVKDTQRGKKRENYFTIKFPKKEGPANKETTIKEYKFRSRDQIGKAMSRMGGGMMQKPMGYRSGTMIKARGCKLGRTRPTKII